MGMFIHKLLSDFFFPKWGQGGAFMGKDIIFLFYIFLYFFKKVVSMY